MIHVALCSLALALGGNEPDHVLLKSGKTLDGRVLFDDGSSLVLRRDRRDTTLAWSEIERVDSRLRAEDALLDGLAKADLGRLEALELLAWQAQESGLHGEAEVLWWRVLALDPAFQGAHEALGHRKRGEGWALAWKGRTLELAKRAELARDWGSAYEFSTLHYRLRSNLALDVVLDVAIRLERIYRGFYRTFGGDLHLLDVTAPMSVELYATSAAYPETSIERGQYDAQLDVVRVDASNPDWYRILAHELSHQLLYDTAYRERRTAGSLPAWLDEGLAEYLGIAACRASDWSEVAAEPDGPSFRAHVQARDPYDLTRVLAFDTEDYFATSNRELKYAQSYTLVHFLLHGEQGRHRAGFLAFLRQVYAGKGSSTDLKHALDANWRDLERDWTVYAVSAAR